MDLDKIIVFAFVVLSAAALIWLAGHSRRKKRQDSPQSAQRR